MWCGLDLTWWLSGMSIQNETSCPRGVGLNQHGDWVMCPFIVKLLVRVLWAWTWWLDGVSMNSETTCQSVVGLNLNDDCDVSIHSETSCPCVVGLTWHDDWVMCPFRVRLLVHVVWAWPDMMTVWYVHSEWDYLSMCCGLELIWWLCNVSIHSETFCPCVVGLSWHDD